MFQLRDYFKGSNITRSGKAYFIEPTRSRTRFNTQSFVAPFLNAVSYSLAVVVAI